MTAPARQLSDANVGGTGLGQSASDLISFHGVTPVDQYAFISNLPTTSVVASTTTGFVFTTSGQANELIAAVNTILTLLKEKGLMASA